MKIKPNAEQAGSATPIKNAAELQGTTATDLASQANVNCTPTIKTGASTGEPRVDSRALAGHLGNKHQNLFELLKKHRPDFEELGILRFQTGVIEGRGQPEKFAMLNEDQSLLALTYSRNTDRVRHLKVKLVKAFGEARRAAEKRVVEYLPEYHLVHDRIKALAAGSPNEKFVHMNVNRSLNTFAGIESGQRGSAPAQNQSLLNVGQMVASRALEGARDHRDGYERFKKALASLTSVLALGAA